MMSVLAEKRTRVGADRLFYLAMALVIAVTVFVGFGTDIARPQNHFATAPLQVYVHGAVFSLWIVFFVLQSSLIVAGSRALHMRLGWFGLVLAVLMVGLGISTTVMALRMHRVPPFFPPSIFLVLDVVGILAFGGLVAAAVLMRKRADWHRRLMLCATIMVMSPALGRILPMAALGPLSSWAVFASMLAYVATGMVFDKLTRGRIHPAYYWGAGVLTLTQVLIGALAFTPPVLRLTAQIVG
jgi:hypothetical protein